MARAFVIGPAASPVPAPVVIDLIRPRIQINAPKIVERRGLVHRGAHVHRLIEARVFPVNDGRRIRRTEDGLPGVALIPDARRAKRAADRLRRSAPGKDHSAREHEGKVQYVSVSTHRQFRMQAMRRRRPQGASVRLARAVACTPRPCCTEVTLEPGNAPGGTRTSDLRFRRRPVLSHRAGPSLHPLQDGSWRRVPGASAFVASPDGSARGRAGVSPGRLTRWSLHLLPASRPRWQLGSGLPVRPRGRVKASPSSPGSPRIVLAAHRRPRSGPLLFAEGNRRSIQLSYGRS